MAKRRWVAVLMPASTGGSTPTLLNPGERLTGRYYVRPAQVNRVFVAVIFSGELLALRSQAPPVGVPEPSDESIQVQFWVSDGARNSPMEKLSGSERQEALPNLVVYGDTGGTITVYLEVE